jgi:hypothetical protein
MWGVKSRLAGIFFGCCLGVAASGCALQRTGLGYLLGDRPSPEPSNVTAKGDQNPTQSDKRELLPWRSRLKNSRLAARFFHGKDEETTGWMKEGELAMPHHLADRPERRPPDLAVE